MSRVLVRAITAPDVITPDAATEEAVRDKHHIENLGVPPPSGLHPRLGRLLDLRLGSVGVQSADGARQVARASTSAACFSTTVPLKKSGFTSPQKRTAFVNMKSRKSSSVSSPCSTNS